MKTTKTEKAEIIVEALLSKGLKVNYRIWKIARWKMEFLNENYQAALKILNNRR